MPNPKRQLSRRVYPLRALGMGLAGLVVGVVLWERNASLAAWLMHGCDLFRVAPCGPPAEPPQRCPTAPKYATCWWIRRWQWSW